MKPKSTFLITWSGTWYTPDLLCIAYCNDNHELLRVTEKCIIEVNINKHRIFIKISNLLPIFVTVSKTSSSIHHYSVSEWKFFKLKFGSFRAHFFLHLRKIKRPGEWKRAVVAQKNERKSKAFYIRESPWIKKLRFLAPFKSDKCADWKYDWEKCGRRRCKGKRGGEWEKNEKVETREIEKLISAPGGRLFRIVSDADSQAVVLAWLSVAILHGCKISAPFFTSNFSLLVEVFCLSTLHSSPLFFLKRVVKMLPFKVTSTYIHILWIPLSELWKISIKRTFFLAVIITIRSNLKS